MIKRIIVGSAIAAGSWAAYSNIRRWWATWGLDPVETSQAMPGDDLVADPSATDTRGITIVAPPATVWPFLVQMGYGRGGWYSYDAMDMKGKSSDSILPEFQQLAVGDIVPTDPDGGFVVKVVEPEHALVLYVDQDTVAARGPLGATVDEVAPGLAFSGRFLQTATPSRFSAAWAFMLEEIEGGQTRLVERVRVRMDTTSSGSRLLGPALGFGVFVMTQRQMLGIKARAEKLARGREVLHRDVDEIIERAMTTPPEVSGAEAAPAAG
jgi:hypothetical protein